jgi:hypothetical protein
VLVSQGRSFPVAIEYLQRSPNFDQEPVWDVAARECERVAGLTGGDMLVFMPGAYEINRTLQAIQGGRGLREFVSFPLHGELPPEQQDRAVERYEARKIIVSTNVAETSLTIDGVTAVIDCGLARIARFDPHRGINTLLVEKISAASADQRAGRAGRTAPGVCVRLWTEREHGLRAPQELPEVKRLDLSEVVLTLKASGIDDVFTFPRLDKPDARALERELKTRRYTLEMEQAEKGENVLDSFLFEWRAGHCEYFATAMTMMLRQQGIPARIVNGFLGADYNSVGGYWAVRQNYAHSWVEAYFPGRGWVMFDPTPGGPTVKMPGASLWTTLQMGLDTARLAWFRWVVE